MRAVILHSISKTGSELIKNNDNKCMIGLYIDRPFNCLTINMSILNLVISTVLRRLQNHTCTKGLVVITSYEGLRKHQVCARRRIELLYTHKSYQAINIFT